MIHQIVLITFLGLPLVVYGGIITFLSFLFTATIGFTNYRNIRFVSFKWHPIMVVISFILAIIHMIFAFSITFGY